MPGSDTRELELKRLALQIAVQLPDDVQDALAVLAFSAELVTGFLRASASPDPPGGGPVVPLRRRS